MDDDLLKVENEDCFYTFKKVKIFKKFEMYSSIIVITDEKGKKEKWNY